VALPWFAMIPFVEFLKGLYDATVQGGLLVVISFRRAIIPKKHEED
jgi:hypothetical protein